MTFYNVNIKIMKGTNMFHVFRTLVLYEFLIKTNRLLDDTIEYYERRQYTLNNSDDSKRNKVIQNLSSKSIVVIK